MRWHAVGALIAKDLRLFFRNRFFAFITVLGLGMLIAIYLLMPRTLDETLTLGLYAPEGGAQVLLELIEEEDAEGLEWRVVDSDAALRQAVLDDEVAAGIVWPADLLAENMAGRRPLVGLYLRADAPPEMRELMTVLVEGLSLALSDQPLQIEAQVEVLGPDLAGEAIPYRDRMLPLLAVVVLMIEIFGLASLLAEEIETGTVRALLTTPLSAGQLFAAKGVTSVLLSYSQAVLFMAAIGALARQPLILLVALLLGAVLVTGIGFLLAAGGRDMLSVVGLGTLALVLLSIPPFGIVFPGTLTGWARAIPSYYLAAVVHQAANLGAGWGQVWQPLLILLGFDLLLCWAGVVVLRRRFT